MRLCLKASIWRVTWLYIARYAPSLGLTNLMMWRLKCKKYMIRNIRARLILLWTRKMMKMKMMKMTKRQQFTLPPPYEVSPSWVWGLRVDSESSLSPVQVDPQCTRSPSGLWAQSKMGILTSVRVQLGVSSDSNHILSLCNFTKYKLWFSTLRLNLLGPLFNTTHYWHSSG